MTQPRPASAALVPEIAPGDAPGATPAHLTLGPALPDDLIAPAAEVFDLPALRRDLFARLSRDVPEAETRKITVVFLAEAQTRGRAAIAESFAAVPLGARRTIRAYSWLTDGIVTLAHEVATEILHRNSNPSEAERLSVLAVGGYGRGEMAPFSDVDLLFLTPYKITPWAESVIESMLYILWDIKLKVGHSSRTVRDCLRLGAEDFTIRTAMLEKRFICGDAPLAEELEQRLWDDLFNGTERDFIAAKLDERSARHRKQGGQRYMVEPNIKEGKGGLRDLQSLFWITKYVYQTEDMRSLVAPGVFRPEELDTFLEAHKFLWAARCHLHLAAGRAVEQLSFDMQVEVADRMAYTDKAGRRAVEWFMQDYFRHATAVGDLTRIVLSSLEADHRKDAPLLRRWFKRSPKVKDGFAALNGRLTFADPSVIFDDNLNLLRLFNEGLRTGIPLHPQAMRLVKANLPLIDKDMRASREASKIFFDTLLKHGNPERALRRMNELGVLAAFIPEFAPVVAMMQFNMYHHYTVDEHTIQCIRHLSEIERDQLVEELPVATSILRKGINRKLLYTALLCHDIGKGRPEDHSVLGARIARVVAPRLGLSKKDSATVEWLVRHHLLMSDMAQKRDIADPRTVRDFAKAVQTRDRLDLLLLLTVCDIRGVGPDTWNNWKAALLRALYRQTARVLDEGMEALTRENRGSQAKKLLRDRLSDWTGADLKREMARHYPPYWQGLHVTAHEVFARLLRDLGNDEVRIDIHADEDRDATRVCFALADHPGIFSRLAGALALSGANVVDARTYTSKDGFALSAFWIQDGDGSPYEPDHMPRLQRTILRTLKGEVVTQEAMIPRDKLKKREKAFRVPTSIAFDNDGSDIYTIIEVDTRDRPGLLHDLTRALAEMNIYIASAVIATYGEQVVDSFYVKDMFGLKFHSDAKLKKIESRLRAAIAEGAQRALG